MAERDGEKAGGPKPPAGPRPRGGKKGEERDEKHGSPRKGGREGRKADASLDGDGNSKEGSRHSNRKSKEKLIFDNWRPQFEQFLVTNDGETFAQTNRTSMYLQFIPLSVDEFIVLTRVPYLLISKPHRGLLSLQALSANIPLRTLGLSSCQISDDQCQKLLEALTYGSRLICCD